jgi:hypothetical protein
MITMLDEYQVLSVPIRKEVTTISRVNEAGGTSSWFSSIHDATMSQSTLLQLQSRTAKAPDQAKSF